MSTAGSIARLGEGGRGSTLADELAYRTLELCAIPSETKFELIIADEVEALCRRIAGDAAVTRVGNSIICDPAAGAPSSLPRVALVGHLDTVKCAADQPTEIRDGRVYGCGSSDMKAGVATMIALLERWRSLTASYQPVWLFYDKEEGPHAENGLEEVLESPALLPLDLAIVLEPTDQSLQMGCMGTMHATVTVHGKRAHSARPWQGENAVYRAITLLENFAGLQRREVCFGDLTFYEVMVVTKVWTENSANVVPDRVMLNVNLRFAPGRTSSDALADLVELVGDDGEVEVVDAAPSGRVYLDHPLIEPWRVRRGLKSAAKQAWTDVARFTERGIPAVNFGPGETAQAHQAGEWCSINSLVFNFEALTDFFGAGGGESPGQAVEPEVNPLIDGIPASLIRSIAAKKRAGDLDLGLGEPTLPPDIRPFEAALEWTRVNGSPYSPNAGFPELREAIGRYLGARHPRPTPRHSRESGNPAVEGSPGEADSPASAGKLDSRLRGTDEPLSVCVTVGSEEALYLAIKTVIDPSRDEVLIVEPCYLAYPKLCMLEGIRYRMVALSPDDQFRPRAAAILEQIRPDTRLIIINSPCNPTGRVWPADELQQLAEGLENRAEEPVYVLTDEVYRELHFGDVPPASIADYHPHTLIAGSLSKSSSLTGLRLGWLAGPAAPITAAIKVHQFVNTAASTFSQRVALEIFADPEALSSYRSRYAMARSRLVDSAARLGLDLIPPEGAFYGFIRLPHPHAADSLAFSERLLDQKRVVTVPGRAFGESGEGWLRVSWVADPDVVEEGLRRIAEELKR